MKYIKITIIFIFLLSAINSIYSQDEDNAASLRKTRENRLSYGLNNEISELIRELIADKDISYNKELLELFKTTKNTQIQKDIIELFSVTESDSLSPDALKKIENRDYENKTVVIAAIRYISSIVKNTDLSLFVKMLDDNQADYRVEAVKALCESGGTEYTEQLMDIYTNDENTLVKLQILLDIGKLKDKSTVDFLKNIIADKELERTYRQYAINSLGIIKDNNSFDDLSAAYQEEDPFIRIYALSALAGYDRKEADTIIFEALKDENWRIRKEAALAAGRKKNNDFIKMLIYRGDNDPVEDIRLEAFNSLGEIGGGESMEYLRNKAGDSRIVLKIRRHAFNICINRDLAGSLKLIDDVFEKEWHAANKTLLEAFSSDLSKIKSPLLDSYFEKMLEHSSVVIKISGIKGIKLNKISSLKEKVKAISEDKNQSLSIINNALAALEAL